MIEWSLLSKGLRKAKRRVRKYDPAVRLGLRSIIALLNINVAGAVYIKFDIVRGSPARQFPATVMDGSQYAFVRSAPPPCHGWLVYELSWQRVGYHITCCVYRLVALSNGLPHLPRLSRQPIYLRAYAQSTDSGKPF
jgi:hypothetical protein